MPTLKKLPSEIEESSSGNTVELLADFYVGAFASVTGGNGSLKMTWRNLKEGDLRVKKLSLQELIAAVPELTNFFVHCCKEKESSLPASKIQLVLHHWHRPGVLIESGPDTNIFIKNIRRFNDVDSEKKSVHVEAFTYSVTPTDDTSYGLKFKVERLLDLQRLTFDQLDCVHPGASETLRIGCDLGLSLTELFDNVVANQINVVGRNLALPTL